VGGKSEKMKYDAHFVLDPFLLVFVMLVVGVGSDADSGSTCQKRTRLPGVK
jgi:hypothetical protein